MQSHLSAGTADISDLWAELREVPEVLTAAQAADASNAPFTADEQANIGGKLDDVKQLVREQFELTAEQVAAFDKRLDDIKAASTLRNGLSTSPRISAPGMAASVICRR